MCSEATVFIFKVLIVIVLYPSEILLGNARHLVSRPPPPLRLPPPLPGVLLYNLMVYRPEVFRASVPAGYNIGLDFIRCTDVIQAEVAQIQLLSSPKLALLPVLAPPTSPISRISLIPHPKNLIARHTEDSPSQIIDVMETTTRKTR
jgi:hypothetical protein